MQLQTKYITVDEFDQYFQQNLRLALGGDENAIGFLKRIEDRMATYLDSNFNRNVEAMYPEFTEYQKYHYKLALLEQAIYIFRNGDISVDSGLDTDRGEVVKHDRLAQAEIAPNAIDNLRLCCLWNRNIRGNYCDTIFPFFWW